MDVTWRKLSENEGNAYRSIVQAIYQICNFGWPSCGDQYPFANNIVPDNALFDRGHDRLSVWYDHGLRTDEAHGVQEIRTASSTGIRPLRSGQRDRICTGVGGQRLISTLSTAGNGLPGALGHDWTCDRRVKSHRHKLLHA